MKPSILSENLNPDLSYVLHPDPEALNIYSVAESEALLRKANEAYHNGAPIMQDGEYDGLWRRHLEARRRRPGASDWRDTILDKVGAAPAKASGFRKTRHATPMLSLDNVFEQADHTCQELDKWARVVVARCGLTVEILAEPKIDGLSLSLVYLDGSLHTAVTRGDGCLDGDSILEFEDGRRMSIRDVVSNRPEGRVRCRDLNSDADVWGTVEDFFQNGVAEDWLVIEMEDGRELRLTPDHRVFVVGRGFVTADTLVEGDQLLDASVPSGYTKGCPLQNSNATNPDTTSMPNG